MTANAVRLYLDVHVDNGRGGRTALECGDNRGLTYQELHDLVCRAAAVLRRAGVGRGDRVVVALPDGFTFVACALAVMRIGAVGVPMSQYSSPAHVGAVARDCRPTAAVLAAGMATVAEVIAEELPESVVWQGDDETMTGSFAGEISVTAGMPDMAEPRDPTDAAWLQYTSGSTGEPKGVIWPHSMLDALPRVAGGWYDQDDRCFCTSKLSAGYAFMDGVLLPLSAGATSILRPGRTDPMVIAHVLETARPTLVYSLPTVYSALLSVPDAAERFDFSGVRRCVSSGEYLPAALVARFARVFGIGLVNEFGSSEGGDMLATMPGRTAPGSCGRPFPGVSARVVDAAGDVLPDGRSGFLEISSAAAATGYWNRPTESAMTFRDGWVRTGDVVQRVPSGDYIYIGRLDDIINIGGVKTVPTAVEEQILRVPEVASCAVVATTAPDGLPIMTAFVVPLPGVSPGRALKRTIRDHLRCTIGGEHSPNDIVFTDALPTTGTGKTAKGQLRRERTTDTTPSLP